MLTLLFSAIYPGPDVPLWQYFGASLDHSVLALCFATLALSTAGKAFTIHPALSKRSRTAD